MDKENNYRAVPDKYHPALSLVLTCVQDDSAKGVSYSTRQGTQLCRRSAQELSRSSSLTCCTIPQSCDESVPWGQCQGNGVTWFSPHSFILTLCHNAQRLPAEDSLLVTKLLPVRLTDKPVQRQVASGHKHATLHLAGSRGMVPQDQARRISDPDETIKNISFPSQS